MIDDDNRDNGVRMAVQGELEFDVIFRKVNMSF